MNNTAFYFDVLYPLQDRVLKAFNRVETGFYLTGGTAASRGYLQHRFSDDLDFFVNDDIRFGLWVERIIQSFVQSDEWGCQVQMKEERFGRLNLIEGEVSLKIEMVNDVPARVGKIQDHPALGRLDSAENILANKVTALLDREACTEPAEVSPKTWLISGDFAAGKTCHCKMPLPMRRAKPLASFPLTWRGYYALFNTQTGKPFAGITLRLQMFFFRS